MPNSREIIILHHSAICQDGKDQFERVNAYHKSQGFPISSLGYFCGYHLFCEKSGLIIQARSLSDRGAHTDNCGPSDISGVPAHQINFRSIGVCLAGDFTKENPTPEQIYSMHMIVWNLQTMYGSRILLHRETKNTECPGVDLRALYEEEHKRYLEKDLLQKINALKWVKGLRRPLLERAIVRLQCVLGYQSSYNAS